MPIEAKDIISYFGWNETEVDDIDKFKDHVEKQLIKRELESIRGDKELYGKLLSGYRGGITTGVKRAFKKFGNKFDETAFKDKPVEDMVELSIETLANGLNEQITSLKETAGKGTDAQIAEWETKFNKLKTDFDQNNKLLEFSAKQYETEKASWAEKEQSWVEEKKSSKKNDKIEKLWADFKWATSANDLIKEGFISKMNKKYKFDLTEDQKELEIFSAETNDKIPNPTKHATPKTPAEVLMDEGIALSVYSVNPHAKDNKEKTVTQTQTKNTNADEKPINPRRQVNTMIPQIQ